MTTTPDTEQTPETPAPEVAVPETPTTRTDTRAGRDAAKYRQRAQEAEAERDTLAAQLEQARQAHLTKLLGDTLTVSFLPQTGNRPMNPDRTPKPVTETMTLRHPDDFARFTTLTTADLINEAGALDADKVMEHVTELYQRRPELFNVHNQPVPTIGNQPDTIPEKQNDFTGAFAPKKR